MTMIVCGQLSALKEQKKCGFYNSEIVEYWSLNMEQL